MSEVDEQRDERGEWAPDNPCAYAPLFAWPPQPVRLFKWFFGYPGYLWPYSMFHILLATVTWLWLQPALETCATLKPGWISLMLLRNAVLMWIIYGGHHLMLYTLKLHGTVRKYRTEWQETDNKRFMFGNQIYDNIFRSFVLGCPIWTAYEVLYMWSLANGKIPLLAATRHPVWFVAIFLIIPIWRETHFYAVHRLIHWRPLFQTVHRIHHLNYNPGPWAGMAMHWVELLLYISVVLIHWVVASHPIHFFFNAQLTALTPAYGHHGFEGPLFKGKFPTGSYFHYLHHRYVSCNFGESTVPLDKWFGRFYDGRGPYKTK
ncbi:MAG: sterol desaturase family protein [Lentisphaerae bacterium]|nr:sterol desaturase family protein [Lentisphaerota bacterium]